jgi:malate dehydrogenase (oxaloacetate-decarboxylating)(NADP+)
MMADDKGKGGAGPASGDLDEQALFFHRYPINGKL